MSAWDTSRYQQWMHLSCEISALGFGQIEIVERKTHCALPEPLCGGDNACRQRAFSSALTTTDPQHAPGSIS